MIKKLIAPAAGLLFCLTALSGCGTASGPQKTRQDAINAFVDAANNGDAKAICAVTASYDDKPIKEGSSDEKQCLKDLGSVPDGLDLDVDKAKVGLESTGNGGYTYAWGDVRATARHLDGGWLLSNVYFE